MNIIHFVYALTFQNGKVYVGMSRYHPKEGFGRRFREHRRQARRGSKNLVHAAWRKYGEPSQSIIGWFLTRTECAEAEIEAIKSMDSMNPIKGYNLAAGGEGMNIDGNPLLYELMRQKVWHNEERRRKSSEALKGRKPSQKAFDASKAWRNTDKAQVIMREKVWDNPVTRAKHSEQTRHQMANGGAEALRAARKGRPDHLDAETREIVRQKQNEFWGSPAGKDAAKRGYAAFASNPENIQKALAGMKRWRESDKNKDHCKEIAKLSAKACSRKVKLVDQDMVFNSQREMAIHYGVSDASISLWVKSGKAVRI